MRFIFLYRLFAIMIRKWTERLWLDCIQQIVPMWQCNFNWKRAHEHITKSLAVRAVLKRVSHDLSNTLTKFSNLSFLVLQDNTFIIYLSRIFLSTLHENFTCPPWWDEITRKRLNLTLQIPKQMPLKTPTALESCRIWKLSQRQFYNMYWSFHLVWQQENVIWFSWR